MFFKLDWAYKKKRQGRLQKCPAYLLAAPVNVNNSIARSISGNSPLFSTGIVGQASPF